MYERHSTRLALRCLLAVLHKMLGIPQGCMHHVWRYLYLRSQGSGDKPPRRLIYSCAKPGGEQTFVEWSFFIPRIPSVQDIIALLTHCLALGLRKLKGSWLWQKAEPSGRWSLSGVVLKLWEAGMAWKARLGPCYRHLVSDSVSGLLGMSAVTEWCVGRCLGFLHWKSICVGCRQVAPVVMMSKSWS